jgi:hypothetical protein
MLLFKITMIDSIPAKRIAVLPHVQNQHAGLTILKKSLVFQISLAMVFQIAKTLKCDPLQFILTIL